MQGFTCLDCRLDTHQLQEYYMVHDSVWYSVAEEPGMLCIGCLEIRLGRNLTSSDFTDCALNRGFFPQSKRLKNRIAVA